MFRASGRLAFLLLYVCVGICHTQHAHTHVYMSLYIGHAANRSSATPDDDIFARLYKEAEERERQYQVQRSCMCEFKCKGIHQHENTQVKRIEAHLVALDLASTTTKGSRGRPSGRDGERKGEAAEIAGNEGVGGAEGGRDGSRQPHVPLWEVLRACVCVCMHVCACVCLRACLCVCVLTCMHTHASAHTHAHTRTHSHAYSHQVLHADAQKAKERKYELEKQLEVMRETRTCTKPHEVIP